MRRLLMAAIVAMVAVVGAVPASAHHVPTGEVDGFFRSGPYDAARWADSGVEYYCASPEFTNGGVHELGAAQFDNMVASADNKFGHWKGATEIDKEITSYADPVCDWNLNFHAAYDNAGGDRLDFCEHRPAGQQSSIQYEDLSYIDSDTIALTWHCDTNDDTYLDYFVMILDPKSNFHWKMPDNPGANEWDWPAIVAHEAGHAYGFGIHWADDSETCPNNSNHQTMCSDGYGYFEGFGVPPYDRTLGDHDIGETDQNWP